MNSTSHSRPDTARALKALKDFQLRTVDYAFRRLYADKDYTRRFLIADEVGLGKTLVARGIIAKAVDHLWDNVERIDVVYICSNADIARQNIARLNIAEEHDFTPPSRLTLLPLHVHGLTAGRRLNFVAFTPGTSFDLKSSGGMAEERALLWRVLKEPWELKGKSAINVFSHYMKPRNFQYQCDWMDWQDIDGEITKAFLKRLDRREKEEKKAGRDTLRQRYDRLRSVFCRSDAAVSKDDEADRAGLMGELRRQMAETCLEWLQPDLIILDEFQRFKHLLDHEDPAGELAKSLFDYSDEHSAARVILLSATPYKMYTRHQEAGADNHYEDFMGTIRFLLNSQDRTKQVEKMLDVYSKELHRLPSNGESELLLVKTGLETALRSVMVRTERLAKSSDRNGMLKEVVSGGHSLAAIDIDHYLAHARIGAALNGSSIIEYWKSAPFLLNFMDEYQLKKEFKSSANAKTDPVLRDQMLRNKGALLSHGDIKRYRAIDPSNARLRGLLADTIDSGAWRLLWLPPSLPYYRLTGVFTEPAAASFTKRLVFSCWHIVPKVIAAIASYEAERRCALLLDPAARNTKEERIKRKPLLKFALSDNRLTGMPVLGMIYPCEALAVATDPYAVARDMKKSALDVPSFQTVMEVAKGNVERLLAEIKVDDTGGKAVDEDWYWAAPILMDVVKDGKSLKRWFGHAGLSAVWSDNAGDKEDDAEARWDAHVQKAGQLVRDFQGGTLRMGRKPADLVEVLAWIGLGGPGACIWRAMKRLGIENKPIQIKNKAAKIAYSFLTLFNLPESMSLIRGMEQGKGDRKPYWQLVLEYSAAGCLQAVLDEYVHILRESLGLIDASATKTLADLAEAISSALRLRTSRVGYDHIVTKPRSQIRLYPSSMRVRYAMRFGKLDAEEEGGEPTREDQVRAAFNSPFWPFILATTSIGQEGLDFHQYCHAVVHWNLPANPVDMEQREGRVHRYKGHAVRKNIARRFGVPAEEGPDPWAGLFGQARSACAPNSSEIEPFWVFPVDGGASIERHVPMLPLSRDEVHLADLKRALSLYRLVFGQLRQEDLLRFLTERLSPEKASEMAAQLPMNLEPPADYDMGRPKPVQKPGI